jgi:hypothetical protein
LAGVAAATGVGGFGCRTHAMSSPYSWLGGRRRTLLACLFLWCGATLAMRRCAQWQCGAAAAAATVIVIILATLAAVLVGWAGGGVCGGRTVIAAGAVGCAGAV